MVEKIGKKWRLGGQSKAPIRKPRQNRPKSSAAPKYSPGGLKQLPNPPERGYTRADPIDAKLTKPERAHLRPPTRPPAGTFPKVKRSVGPVYRASVKKGKK